MSTFEKIKGMLVEKLGVSEELVKPESELVKDLGADSLDLFDMQTSLEDEYGITLTEEQSVSIVTVQDLVNLIEK